MIWLILSLVVCTAIVVAGRAHSRRLDELENLLTRHKIDRS